MGQSPARTPQRRGHRQEGQDGFVACVQLQGRAATAGPQGRDRTGGAARTVGGDRTARICGRNERGGETQSLAATPANTWVVYNVHCQTGERATGGGAAFADRTRSQRRSHVEQTSDGGRGCHEWQHADRLGIDHQEQLSLCKGQHRLCRLRPTPRSLTRRSGVQHAQFPPGRVAVWVVLGWCSSDEGRPSTPPQRRTCHTFEALEWPPWSVHLGLLPDRPTAAHGTGRCRTQPTLRVRRAQRRARAKARLRTSPPNRNRSTPRRILRLRPAIVTVRPGVSDADRSFDRRCRWNPAGRRPRRVVGDDRRGSRTVGCSLWK